MLLQPWVLPERQISLDTNPNAGFIAAEIADRSVDTTVGDLEIVSFEVVHESSLLVPDHGADPDQILRFGSNGGLQGSLLLYPPGGARVFAQALLFGPGGDLFVPILNEGVVVLRGVVPDLATAWRAEALARAVPGTKEVINRLLLQQVRP